MANEFSLLCPIVTPFHRADDGVGQVDTDSLAAVVTHLTDAGVDGLVPVARRVSSRRSTTGSSRQSSGPPSTPQPVTFR